MTFPLAPLPQLPRLADHLLPAPTNWGVFDCQRLATATEMTDAGNHCGECGFNFAAKVGGGLVAGTVIGRRTAAGEAWTWTGVLCRDCEIAHAVADGY